MVVMDRFCVVSFLYLNDNSDWNSKPLSAWRGFQITLWSAHMYGTNLTKLVEISCTNHHVLMLPPAESEIVKKYKYLSQEVFEEQTSHELQHV